MYRRNSLDIVAAGGLALLGGVAGAAHLPAAIVIVLGVALFLGPGYVWSEVILNHRLPGLERVAVIAGISLITPILCGFIVYSAGVPLHRTTWIGILSVVTLVGAVVAAIQRRGAAPLAEERRPDRPQERRGIPVLHSIIFGAAAVIALAAVGLSVMSAEAQKYPGYAQLSMVPVAKSKPLTATLRVTNQQGSSVQYRLVLSEKVNKRTKSTTWNLSLANGQSWQRTVPYTLQYSMVADLYQLPNLKTPYRRVNNGE